MATKEEPCGCAVRVAILTALAFVAAWPSQVSAQTYQPGPAPTVGEIQTETLESPDPRDRTDVGIGEQVKCWINTATWEDKDLYVPPYGDSSYVYDDIGVVTWSATKAGGGAAGTFMPPMGPTTTLTIGLLAADDTVTIEAKISDAGKFASDAPLQAPIKRLKVLQVYTPNRLEVLTHTAEPPSTWIKPGNKAFYGARTLFLYRVIQKDETKKANFYGVPFVIKTNAAETWNWDDGTQGSYPTVNKGYPVASFSTDGGKTLTHNLANIYHSTGLISINKVKTFPFNPKGPPSSLSNPHYYYLDAEKNFLSPQFTSATVKWNWPGGDPPSQQVQVGVQTGTANVVWGVTQGPWDGTSTGGNPPP